MVTLYQGDRHTRIVASTGGTGMIEACLGTMKLLKEVPNLASRKKEVPGRAFQGSGYLSFVSEE